MTAKSTSKSTAKPAEKPAEKPVPSFDFEDAPVPAQTRKSTAVNPLLDVSRQIAETLPENGEKSTVAKSVTVANSDQVKQVKRWLALAGKELGVTMRSVVDGTKVTFWAVPRIEHKDRKNADKS